MPFNGARGGQSSRPWALWPVFLCTGLFLPLPVWAGAPTLTSITLDGNMGDWSAVLANPQSHSTDAPGNTPADLDFSVPADRDLLDFAYTWDNTNLYFYTRRRANASSVRRIMVYVDRDNDGRMQNSDYVLVTRWYSNFGLFTINRYNYVSASFFGDLMVDGAGSADGHTLPGNINNASSNAYSAYSSHSSGLELEYGVPWAELGVAPGTPLSLHVSMANNDNPNTVKDNMAGLGGGPLSTGFARLAISAGTTLSASNGETIVLAHDVENLGNLDNTVIEFSHTWSCAGVPGVSYYLDINGNGVLDSGVDALLSDSNADTRPDTRIDSGQIIQILVEATLPTGLPAGSACNLDIRVEPANDPACGGTSQNVINVAGPTVVLLKNANTANAQPGQPITYSTMYQNTGADTAFVVVILDAVPTNTTYVPGSATGPGTNLEYSHDGGSNFDTSDELPVTHIRWSLMNPLSQGGSGTVTFQVIVD